MPGTDTILYSILTEEKFVNKKLLDDIIAKEGLSGSYLLSALTDRGMVSETEVLKSFAKKLKLPYKLIKKEKLEPSLFKKIPVKIASHYQFVPLEISDRNLTIAVCYPPDIKTQDAIRLQLGYDISVVLTNKSDILQVFKENYGLAANTVDKISAGAEKMQSDISLFEDEELQDIEKMSESATVEKLVNEIIFDAYKNRATDIHIEPYRDHVRFRYRIDGI
ncbi:MAG: hypothetical protein JW994_04680, partial [Candidatus Omnitrophica bacterium]|nr:hypothetical protein [Candidatus Omnitrophota bacterium]